MKNSLDLRLSEALTGFRRDGIYKRLNFLEGPREAKSRESGV